MNNVAEKLESTGMSLDQGLVLATGPRECEVALDWGLARLKTAKSCLMRPVEGDTVLVCSDSTGNGYILAVLEGHDLDGSGRELVVEGPVRFKVSGGEMNLEADGGINLATPDKIALASDELDVSASRGRAGIGEMSFAGRFFSSRIEEVRTLARSVDSICQRLVQRLTTSYRYVEEHDEVQAGSSRMLVDGVMSVHTKTTMHTSEGHIKLDAEQIHLG